jgi:predicted RNase H-like nuclease (RuvC/YqgF family)
MSKERMINNDGVPVETLFKWQSREVYKLRAQLEQKNKTIKKLRNNITMLLRDPEVKLRLTKDLMLREKAREIAGLQKELHRVRQAEKKILQSLLTYQLKEINGQESM